MKTVVRQVENNEKTRWNRIVDHPLQSWEWGDFRQNNKTPVFRFGVYAHGRLTACFQMTSHRIGPTRLCVGYIPKSGIPDTHVLQALVGFAKQQSMFFIQIEPNAQTSSRVAIPPLLIPSKRPLFPAFTYVLDLTQSEETLFASFHHKTRYNIRLARRHGVVVSEDNSDTAFDAYIQLHNQTTKRQAFYAHDEHYHRHMWETMRKAGIARLFTASHKSTILAAWIIFVWKDTLYYPYGASSQAKKHVMAPNLLLWEIARWGMRHSFKAFDLWGALGPNPDPKDPWYGFDRFKAGYNPKRLSFVGSYDLPVNALLYRGFSLANTARWFVLNSMHRLLR